MSEQRALLAVWIRQYPFMPLDLYEVNDYTMFPQAVWFLDKNGLRQENVWKWRRLVTVHLRQPWCSKDFKEPSPFFDRSYPIGLAAFAPYDGDKFYMEVQWGSLFGKGWEVTINEQGKLLCMHEKWIS